MPALRLAEILHRGHRYAQTLRHLRLIQITDRLRRRLLPPQPDLAPAPKLRIANSAFARPCQRRPRYAPANNTFRALNLERIIANGAVWNDPTAPKLWLYNLHYFDDLPDAAGSTERQAYAVLVARWIAENPPGQGAGWEAYPLSLRIVNWIKWALRDGELSLDARHSLAVQTRFLKASLEYHLLANHLWANGKALLIAGLFFDGAEADHWRATGASILSAEMDEQILSDGGHFELSPMYHAIIAEDLLDLCNVCVAFGWTGLSGLRSKAGSMLSWLQAMTRDDGRFPLFNDAAYGVAPDFETLADYAGRLGIAVPVGPVQGTTWLRPSGYVCMRHKRYSLFADIGELGPSYNPAHGHCDMLSFELAVDGGPLIVDTGTSTYEAGPRRLAERGTAAHNTVQIGDAEQSDLWSAFRAGRRAHIVDLVHREGEFEAAHDGFAAVGVIHRRAFKAYPEELVIEDWCVGRARTATARLHLHPLIAVEETDGVFRAGPATIAFKGAEEITIERFQYAPEFNLQIPSRVIVARFHANLTTRISL